MRKVFAIVIFAFILNAAVVHSEPIEVDSPLEISPSHARIGEYVDVNQLLPPAIREIEATVIVVHQTGCPINAKYAPTLRALAKRYEAKPVRFVVLSANEGRVEKIRNSLRQLELPFALIPDPDRKVCGLLGVRSSGDVFVLDRAQTLVYRGPIDNQYGLGYQQAHPNQNYLISAIDSVLQKRAVEVPALLAPGCSTQSVAAKSGEVTFHSRISRLVQYRCAQCHRAGENAPFALDSYDDVKEHAPMIRRFVANRRMPPWFADRGVGHWKNDASLTDRDRQDFLDWIDAGMIEGDPRQAPLPRVWAKQWHIGTPDAVIQVPKKTSVPASGTMSYQYAKVALDYPEDRWVQAVEIRPSASAVVHHVLVFLTEPGSNSPERPGLGLEGFFAAYAPGQGFLTLPEGKALKIPKGAGLLFQIHYQPNGVAVEDQPVIGLKFAKTANHDEVRVNAAASRSIRLEPGARQVEVAAEYVFGEPARILTFFPHMHLRGVGFRIELAYPDGKTKKVLNISKYDFNWQLPYELVEPLDVAAGTKLIATGIYDNSRDNPANPDPEEFVTFGEQTKDEMMIGYFSWHSLGASTPKE